MPASLPTRREKAEQRREQILDAAMRMFATKGFAGASIRDIAGEVGVTEGLLYHYFESKEQLLDACWKERSWRANLERILAEKADAPLGEVLHALTSDFLSTLYSQAECVRMFAAEMQRNPEMAEFWLQGVEENGRLIAAFMQRREELGEIAPGANPEAAADLLFGGAYNLFVLRGHAEPAEWTAHAEQFCRTTVPLIVRGLAATTRL